jgi:hypothetical protein
MVRLVEFKPKIYSCLISNRPVKLQEFLPHAVRDKEHQETGDSNREYQVYCDHECICTNLFLVPAGSVVYSDDARDIA